MNLIEPRALVLKAGEVFKSEVFAIPGATAQIALLLRRPTTARPLAWAKSAKLLTRLILMRDGVDVGANGSSSGGVRPDRGGELPYSGIVFQPDSKIDRERRVIGYLGEDAKEFTLQVVIEAVGGDVETEFLLQLREWQRPTP